MVYPGLYYEVPYPLRIVADNAHKLLFQLFGVSSAVLTLKPEAILFQHQILVEDPETQFGHVKHVHAIVVFTDVVGESGEEKDSQKRRYDEREKKVDQVENAA